MFTAQLLIKLDLTVVRSVWHQKSLSTFMVCVTSVRNCTFILIWRTPLFSFSLFSLLFDRFFFTLFPPTFCTGFSLQPRKKDQCNRRDRMTMQHFANCQFRTPGVVVELLPQHIKQSHHWHVENEKAHQTRHAEEAKKRIYPNSSG